MGKPLIYKNAARGSLDSRSDSATTFDEPGPDFNSDSSLECSERSMISNVTHEAKESQPEAHDDSQHLQDVELVDVDDVAQWILPQISTDSAGSSARLIPTTSPQRPFVFHVASPHRLLLHAPDQYQDLDFPTSFPTAFDSPGISPPRNYLFCAPLILPQLGNSLPPYYDGSNNPLFMDVTVAVPVAPYSFISRNEIADFVC